MRRRTNLAGVQGPRIGVWTCACAACLWAAGGELGRPLRAQESEPPLAGDEPAALEFDAPVASAEEQASTATPPPVVDPRREIEAARRALSSRWNSFPWYDAERDFWRPIYLRPRRSWEWQWNGGGFSGPWLQWVAWAGIAALMSWLAYLLWLAYRRRSGGLWKPANQASAEARRPPDIKALPLAPGPDLNDLLGAARRAAQAGDFRRAVIYLFSFQLVELDRQQRIRLERGKTNRQYLGELGAPPLQAAFARSIAVFEPVFFGGRTPSSAEWTAWSDELPRFQGLIGETAP